MRLARLLTANFMILSVTGMVIVGCQPNGTSTHYGSFGWEIDEEPSVPGISRANFSFHRQGDQLVYVVWTDLQQNGVAVGGGRFEDGFSNQTLFRYHYTGQPNEDSNSKRTDTLTVDGQAYRLDEGQLFLVSTQGDRARLKQLHLDKTSVRLFNEGVDVADLQFHFYSMAKQDADVREFFEQAANK